MRVRTQTAEVPSSRLDLTRPGSWAGAEPSTTLFEPADPGPAVFPAPSLSARGPIGSGRRRPASGHRRWARRAFQVALTLVVLLVAYVVVTFAQVWEASTKDRPVHSDAIIVLGAAQYNGRPSPVLAARLDHAASLFEHGVAPVVVVTGGKQPGDRFTEAEASKEYLIDRGVPAAAILEEDKARNSFVSLKDAAAELKGRGMKQVVLVSDPYHAFRINAIAEGLGLDANVSPTQTSPTRGLAEWKALGRETVAVSLGRVLGYGNLSSLEGNY
jgi:uncharacterized SAM-binding protein YcdF (DUF218 family)